MDCGEIFGKLEIQIRKLAKSTILTHLEEAIQQGSDLDLGSLISLEKQSAIKKAIAQELP
jgi:ATP-dependent DNA helicase RecQ